MNNTIKVSASILCADFTKLGDEIKRCEDAGVDLIHIDVMDGQFVPNITIGPVIVEAIRPLTKLPIDAHLMIEHPGRFIDAFMDAGSDIISIQAECYGPRRAVCRAFDQYPKEIDTIDAALAKKDIRRIKERGKKVFMVINPGSAMCLEPLFSEIDGILVMSVNPGFARQKFIPEALGRIRELKSRFRGEIAVDGGVNDKTAPDAVKAGARTLITASYFFGAPDTRQAVAQLKALPCHV